MRRELRSRGSLHYSKAPMAIESLVKRLADRGLEVPSQERAARYLRHIGYYRLSPYTIPFQLGRPDHQFRAGTSFDDVLDLYVFDRELRLLVLDALERVEVAVRAALTDHMATKYNDPHWYADSSYFDRQRRHANLLGIIRDICEKRLMGKPAAGEDSLVHGSALVSRVFNSLLVYFSMEYDESWAGISRIETVSQ